MLVSPTGETSTVYKRRVAKVWGGFLLLDWSADGRTALLSTTDRHGTRLVRVDVTTGAVLELPVPRLDAALLDADGSGVIARSWRRGRSNTLVLDKISWTGTRTRLLDSTSGAMVLGRNGTVVTGDRVQLLLSTTTGAVLKTVPPRALLHPGPLVGRHPAPGDLRLRPLSRRPRDRQHRAADPWAPARSGRLRPPGRS